MTFLTILRSARQGIANEESGMNEDGNGEGMESDEAVEATKEEEGIREGGVTPTRQNCALDENLIFTISIVVQGGSAGSS